MNLAPYNQNGLELVINQETGEAFASIRAVARMTDKSDVAIGNYVNGKLEGTNPMELLDAEILTNGGLQGAKLLNENQILEVVCKYKPILLKKFAACGIRVFLHELAGFKIQSTAIEKVPLTRVELARQLLDAEIERERLEQQIQIKDQHIDNLMEVVDDLYSYSSIIRVAKHNNCSEKAFSYHKLKAASKTLNLEWKKVDCPRFGYKLLYAHEAWQFVYPEYALPEPTSLANG